MFTAARGARELRKYVLVRLYTDGEGEIFQRQQQLQQEKYKTVALPFYAIVECRRQARGRASLASPATPRSSSSSSSKAGARRRPARAREPARRKPP